MEFVEKFFDMLDVGWVVSQAMGGNAVPLLTWTLFWFALGLVLGWRVGTFLRKVRAAAEERGSSEKIRSELGAIPGFERVNSVDRLIEKADELRKRPTAGQLAAETERAKELERRLDSARLRIDLMSDMARARAAVTAEPAGSDLPAPVRTPKGRLTVGPSGLSFFPPDMARAALDAIEAYPAPVEIGDREDAIRASQARNDGVFTRTRFVFNGMPGEPDGRYTLAKPWADYLDGESALAELKRVAGR